MDIDKELEEIFDDPLLNVSEREVELFDIPDDMRKSMESRNRADFLFRRFFSFWHHCCLFSQQFFVFLHDISS